MLGKVNFKSIASKTVVPVIDRLHWNQSLTMGPEPLMVQVLIDSVCQIVFYFRVNLSFFCNFFDVKCSLNRKC